ncbi:MucB/RseB C-terminal domain-containing protein [Algicola sagamiensis]|uniref:MucB/RseB C-terminal domain-containing protein n=1 Tax=Algicola sagamiensis TaxID=163869 RepID=UPI0003619673|nr:MucB/RseB C-terminal domain-containing protein [Algicola sagamiensis]
MRAIFALCFSLITGGAALANPVETSPKVTLWLEKLQHGLQGLNYDISYVHVRGNHVEPYRWLHGNFEGHELEYLMTLNGRPKELVRKNNVISHFDVERPPFSLQETALFGPVPEIFYTDKASELNQFYEIVVAGKSRVSGKPAQLLRFNARDGERYDFWIWLDMQTGLPLKTAFIDQKGQALEQIQVTSLVVTETVHPNLAKLHTAQLPQPIDLGQFSKKPLSAKWKFKALPEGFQIIQSNQHYLSRSKELADYFLMSDGVVDVSVFIQQPIKQATSPTLLHNGATTVFFVNKGAYDVTIVGNIPLKLARRISDSIRIE